MNRRLQVPDSDELPGLIRAACDALPAPDSERLEALQQRLSVQLRQEPRRSRHSGRFIWLLLLLFGGSLTAAWWAGVMDRESRPRTGSDEQRTAPAEVSIPATEEQGRREKENNETTDQPGPVIYQRGN